jgi:hypothetical protein
MISIDRLFGLFNLESNTNDEKYYILHDLFSKLPLLFLGGNFDTTKELQDNFPAQNLLLPIDNTASARDHLPTEFLKNNLSFIDGRMIVDAAIIGENIPRESCSIKVMEATTIPTDHHPIKVVSQDLI